MTYVRYRMDPRLAEVLGRLHGTPPGQDLVERLTQLAETAGPAPTGPALAEALRAHRWLLDRASDGGLPLTSAGYLKPADVKPLAAELPTMSDWIFPINREVNAQPVLGFREYVVRAGLLRKHKGTLVVTKAGEAARRGPDVLWQHLAERLLPTRPQFDEMAWIVVLLHYATNAGDRVDTDDIAAVLGLLGWARAGGKPVLASDVQWVANDAWHAVGNVGPSVSRMLERTPSPEGMALIRDALLTER